MILEVECTDVYATHTFDLLGHSVHLSTTEGRGIGDWPVELSIEHANRPAVVRIGSG